MFNYFLRKALLTGCLLIAGNAFAGTEPDSILNPISILNKSDCDINGLVYIAGPEGFEVYKTYSVKAGDSWHKKIDNPDFVVFEITGYCHSKHQHIYIKPYEYEAPERAYYHFKIIGSNKDRRIIGDK